MALPNAASVPEGPHEQLPLSILVVDDSAIDRKLIRRSMDKLDKGAILTEAVDLRSAEAEMAKNRFDLIILDERLPDGEGSIFLHKIRKQSRYTSLPVICLTSCETHETLRMCLAAGANYFLVKSDLQSVSLGRALEQVLGKPREIEPGSLAQQHQLLIQMQSSVTALEQHLAELLEVTQPETATEANMLRGEMEYHCALMRNYLTEMASGIAATRTERAWASQD